MLTVNPYVHFNRNCAEAVRFYERVLGGKIEMMMKVSDTPPSAQHPTSPDMADLVMHTRLSLGNYQLLASDWISSEPYQPMTSFSVSLEYPTVAEARRVHDALAEGGQVRMPLQGTFWAKAFAMLTDRYGMPWMISGEMLTK